MDRDQLAEHLRFAAELGVDGVSRDPAWRERGRESSDAVEPASEQAIRPVTPSDAVPADLRYRLAGEALAGVKAIIGDCTRCKLSRARPHADRVRRRQSRRRSDVRRRGARRRRRRAGHSVRRPRRPAADEDHRGDRAEARGRVHRQRHQVPAAGEPQPRAGRSRDLRAVPVPADRRHQAEGHRRARHVRRAVAAPLRGSDLAPARPRLRLPRREADPDVPSRLPAAESLLEARGVGGHEAGQETA